MGLSSLSLYIRVYSLDVQIVCVPWDVTYSPHIGGKAAASYSKPARLANSLKLRVGENSIRRFPPISGFSSPLLLYMYSFSSQIRLSQFSPLKLIAHPFFVSIIFRGFNGKMNLFFISSPASVSRGSGGQGEILHGLCMPVCIRGAIQIKG